MSKGAIPFKVNNKKMENKLLNLTKKITDVVNLGFCSVDIIETTNNELLVMEINSGVMMKNYINIMKDGYDISKKIYRQALKEMFK